MRINRYAAAAAAVVSFMLGSCSGTLPATGFLPLYIYIMCAVLFLCVSVCAGLTPRTRVAGASDVSTSPPPLLPVFPPLPIYPIYIYRPRARKLDGEASSAAAAAVYTGSQWSKSESARTDVGFFFFTKFLSFCAGN